jgi:hypothetical protein
MKKLIKIVFLIIFLASATSARTQVEYTEKGDSVPGKVWFIKGFFQDEAKLWSSPIRNADKRFMFWVPVIGATMLAMANDEKIYSEFKKFQGKHEWVSKASPVITYGGENITDLSICGLFYAGGLAFHNQKAMQTGTLCLEALVHAGLIVTIGKLITGRQRPGYDDGKDYWHWFPASFKQFGSDPQPKYDAFPSGHTIAAWSVASVIAKQYKNYKLVPILAYTAATGVGLSRITQDAHWMSDVIIGAALGYTIGSFVAKERKNTKWSIFPVSDGKAIILTGVYNL